MMYKFRNNRLEIILYLFRLFKKLLTPFTLFIIPFIGFSQIDSSHIYKAGIELRKYERQYSTGSMMQIAGLGLALAGTATDSRLSARQPLMIGGGVLSFFGFVMQISSASHIKKAGIYLTGNKLVVPLRK